MADSHKDGRRSTLTLLAYALPAIPAAMLLSPTGIILPSFYAKYTAIGLTGVGTVLMVGRLFDAVLDPIVGYLSDHTRSRWGRRKPWMAAGSLLAGLAVWFLFAPPRNAGFFYFLISMTAMYAAFTMLDIPQRAWGAELSPGYDERSRIYAYSGAAATAGFLIFLALPQLSVFHAQNISPLMLDVMRATILCCMPLVWIGLVLAPQGSAAAQSPPALLPSIGAVFRNRPFRLYALSMIAAGVANGFYLSLIYIFLDVRLHIPQAILPASLLYIVAQIAGVPLWAKVSRHIGKHWAWAVSQALYSVTCVVVLLLPSGAAAEVPFLALNAFGGFASAALVLAPAAVLSDIVDYDTLKTGANRAGIYFSLMTLLIKANMGIGGALGFFGLAAIGFDIHGRNSAPTMAIFVALFALIPTVLGLASSLLMAVFPIDRARHDVIRRRLERRVMRAPGPAPSQPRQQAVSFQPSSPATNET